MTIRPISLVEGEYYHVYNRGNSKQKIFFDEHDYNRFVKLLYLCNSRHKVDFREDIVRKKINAFDFGRGENIVSIGAWVLMPNHFHIYVTINKQSSQKLRKTGFRKNEISEFMHKLLTSYSKYFNKKYNRTGILFEARFKSTHINNDNYAKYIFSYIHLNPIKLVDKNWKVSIVQNIKSFKTFLENYKWSSYLDFIGISRLENKILDIKNFPTYFDDIKDLNRELEDWLKFKVAEDGLPQLPQSDKPMRECQIFPLMKPRKKE